MKRRTVLCSLLSIVFVVATAVPAFGGYCYNYAFDYSSHPWNLPYQNVIGAASSAEYQQDLAGHTGLSYYSAYPSTIAANMGAIRHMSISGHAGPGNMLISNSNHYSGTADHAGVLSSNINFTGGVFRLDDGLGNYSDWQTVRQTSYVSNVNNSPARIALYLGCETGADPPSGYNLLYSTTGHAGVDFAGGFTGLVNIRVGTNTPFNQYQYKYWLSLRLGYNAWYSMDLAAEYVKAQYGGYNGFNTQNYRGDGNITL